MKISYKWLKELIDINDLTVDAVAALYAKTGLEVESIEEIASGTNLVIGKVISCIDHPDSDHLHVCQVDVGDEILDIVCGASNCRADIKVIVAKVGAKLPNIEIKESKVRGILSKGMLCSLKELGVSEKRLTQAQLSGIEILADDAPIGNQNVLEYLNLDDVILDIKPTPNRADLLSMHNLAYELGAILKRKVNFQEPSNYISNLEEEFKIEIKSDKISQFRAIVVEGINNLETPSYIKQHLLNMGFKTINALVDIANYVMLMTGQPLHIYDYHKLPKKELIAYFGSNQNFIGLDEKNYELDQQDIVITSGDKVVSLAGVMGSLDSCCDQNTTKIVIEAAIFEASCIRNTSKRLNLNTEAALRFTKGIDPSNPEKALISALNLIIKHCQAQKYSAILGQKVKLEKTIVSENLHHLNTLLGTDFKMEEVVEVLQYLRFNPQVSGDLITCEIPFDRCDINIAQDLDEEVIRLLGLDKLKEPEITLGNLSGKLSSDKHLIRTTKTVLNGFGLDEIITYTLIDKYLHEDALLSHQKAYNLLMPMSEKRALVRDSLFGSILECASYNRARKVKNINIFEISDIDDQNGQQTRLGIFLEGSIQSSKLLNFDLKADFYTLKAMLISYLDTLGINHNRLEFKENNLYLNQFYPFKSTLVYLDKKLFGVFGFIHPKIQQKYDLSESVYGEFIISLLFETKKAKVTYKGINKYPSSNRDLSILVLEEVKASELLKLINSQSKHIIESDIIDIYKGQTIEQGYKSLTISLTYNGLDHTLSEEEINNIHHQVLDALSMRLGAKLRA